MSGSRYRWNVATKEQEVECFRLRAAEYARFYRNIPAERFSDDFDHALTPDGERVCQIVATWEGAKLTGTLRLILSRHPRHPELRSEIAELTDFEWEIVASEIGIPVSELVAL